MDLPFPGGGCGGSHIADEYFKTTFSPTAGAGTTIQTSIPNDGGNYICPAEQRRQTVSC
ncbi:MAG TPA: hypothetical protein VKQ36_05900 [Ktedonobacterales bacterium]|nr:hypothetical protein [Ktedonobacterales bacterium]